MPGPSVVSFHTVHGHQRIGEFLRSATQQDRLPHAMLFAGTDGVGKCSIARAFAAWLLCKNRGDDACGSCASCRQVLVGSHPDFQFVGVVSGKKEIGVDRMRDVKRFMQLQPVSGPTKVAIVDDAHMLTVAAQNALLKTLEEPPPRSLLILVANNPDALLPTVRSRCQRLQFAPLPNDVVIDILTTVHSVDVAVARDAANLAEGSPGRALALSASHAKESRERLLQSLAGLDRARYVQLMDLVTELSQPDAETALKLELLLAQYRDDAVRMVSRGQPIPGHGLRALLRSADAVHEACGLLRRSTPNRQLLLEALLFRLARA